MLGKGRAMFESLESRPMFAVSVTLDGTVLKIVGTDEAETIFVTETAGVFDVGQQVGNDFFPLASAPESMITRVLLVIFAGNGTEAHGDNGQDTLISLEGINTTYLFGGNAKDSLTGSVATIMDGGNGKNIIMVS